LLTQSYRIEILSTLGFGVTSFFALDPERSGNQFLLPLGKRILFLLLLSARPRRLLRLTKLALKGLYFDEVNIACCFATRISSFCIVRDEIARLQSIFLEEERMSRLH